MQFNIDENYEGFRLDKALAGLCDDLSRARLQGLIAQGMVSVNGEAGVKPSYRVQIGDALDITIPAPKAAEPQAEDIPLDVIYEDDDLLVINKPIGLVVHPGAGNMDGTLVNALLHHCGDTLSGIGGVLRPGIVHRLDKNTSGLMVVAKSDRAHQGLAAQLEDRSLHRLYKAVVLGVPQPRKGTVNQTIGRHTRNRLKMAVNTPSGRDAQTHYRVEKDDFGGACSLVECKLQTGRTHQIRVHMEFLGHSLIGDPLYGAQPTYTASVLKKAGYEKEVVDFALEFPRQALHAWNLSFIHPVSGARENFEAPLPDDLFNLLKMLDKL